MINEYYILKHGQQDGPYTHTQLMDMNVEADDFLLSPLAEGLQRAGDLPEFQEYFIANGIYLPNQYNVASFWWRLLAYVIDYIIVMLGLMLLATASGALSELLHSPVDFESQEVDLLLRFVIILALIAYNSIFEATTMQGSIGKLICKLIVVDADGERLTFGKALSRNFSKILSSLLCCIGFLTVLWNPMRQAWHDQIAKTYVIRKS
jgi:uncharacterized RDD family membrane protein YckC